MADPIEFFIDSKRCTTDKATQTVADIFNIVGLSADQLILVSPKGDKCLDAKQNIEIHSGDHFTTEKRDRDEKSQNPVKIHYRINGEQQTTTDPDHSVEQILQSAGKAASIELQQLDSYILENIKTGEKYENLTDMVNILNGDEFLAVHSGATPVAPLLTL